MKNQKIIYFSYIDLRKARVDSNINNYSGKEFVHLPFLNDNMSDEQVTTAISDYYDTKFDEYFRELIKSDIVYTEDGVHKSDVLDAKRFI